MTLEWFLHSLAAPFEVFVDPTNRLSYVYMATALCVAIAVYLYQQVRSGQPQVAGLLRWLLPRDIILHPSARADYLFFLVNKFMHAAVFGSAVIGTQGVYHLTSDGLEAVFGPGTADAVPSFWGTLAATLIIAMVLDATLWFAHYIFHVFPVLWEFHKVHHSAEVMTPITAARMHPVEEIADASVSAVTLGVTVAAIDHVMGEGMRMLTLFEINIFMAAFFLAAFNLRHSHVWVRYPYWLQHIFICPAQHQIHHSRARQHWDRNMGFIFSFWDWAAGTLYAPKGKEDIVFGLGTEEDGTWRSVGMLYFQPFRAVWRRLKGRPAALPSTGIPGAEQDPRPSANTAS